MTDLRAAIQRELVNHDKEMRLATGRPAKSDVRSETVELLNNVMERAIKATLAERDDAVAMVHDTAVLNAEAGIDLGARQERARIVAWLRSDERFGEGITLWEFAEAIERGDHMTSVLADA